MIRDYGDNITYTSQVNPLENHGGEVAVNVNGRVSDKYFHRRAKLELTPVLKFEGGEKEMGSYILRGDRTSGQGTMVNRGADTNFSMAEMVAFEEGMQESELVIRARVYREGKEDYFVNLPDRKVADGVINTSQRIDKGQDLVLVPHGYEKVTTVTESANVYFAYMRHNLNWRLPLNRQEDSQQKIEDLKEFIKRQWEIQSVEINAWASPEGEVAYNEKLSENRAKAVDDYLNNLFTSLQKELGEDIERPDFKVTAKGEDFDGFMEVLNESDLSDKQAIQNVINSQLAPAERERRIKDMTVIYAEIEKLLEPLRRGEIVVTLYEPKKTDEEIAMLSTSDPSQLDVNELLYAATLTDDLQTQLAIYKSAQQLFPQDYKGFNNAAYVYLKMENGEEAAKELERANQITPNMGCVLNNLGVVATWERDIENAQSYFEAAQAKGVRTNYNIGSLMIIKGDYQAALSSFAGRTCTHNIALAHLLAGNESAAMTNLDCAPESAQVAYLKAIIGARRENNTMVFQNLRRAVQLDPAYKEEAKKDREFIRYFNVAEFQELVR